MTAQLAENKGDSMEDLAAPQPSLPEKSSRLKKLVFAFVPSWRRLGVFNRLGITAVVGVLLVGLVIAKTDQTIPLLVAAARYNPVEHAQSLHDQGRMVAAYDFINFYLGIPGAEHVDELNTLKEKIEEVRGSWDYRVGEFWKGMIGEESEESYAKATEFVTEFLPIGDARSLIIEGNHAINGEEVDMLNVSLSGVGLVLSVASFGPQAPAVQTVKAPVSMFKKCLNLMSSSLRKSLDLVFAPFAKYGSDIKNGVKKVDMGSDLIQLVKNTGNKFTDIMSLSKKSPASAMLVVRYSDDVANLADNAKLVAKMGDDAVGILAHGKDAALPAARFLQKSGEITGTVMKKAMLFGEASLRLTTKLAINDIIYKVRLIRSTLSGKLWYFTLWFLSLIPMPVAVGLGAYSSLMLYKMWFFPVSVCRKKRT